MGSPLINFARALPGKLDNALPTPPDFLYRMLGMQPPVAPGPPDTSWHDQAVREANQSFQKPDPNAMADVKPRRKPMSGGQ
jgi:hypothetical protein